METKETKWFFLLFTLIATTIACALFGILHDQVTYSISPEYYTKFKFIQFGLTEKGVTLEMNQRIGAVIVGIKASWWMGIPIGLILGIMILVVKSQKSKYQIYFRALLITFSLTVLISIVGYINWKFHSQYLPCDWYLPYNLTDKNGFICVGTIHNFTYTGAEFGLLIGSLYILLQKRKQKTQQEN